MKKNPEMVSIPTWYELSISDDSKTIFLKVHRLAFQDMQKVQWSSAPFIPHFRDTYGLQSFTPPQEGDCGFSNVLKFVQSVDENWITWSFELPVLKAGSDTVESPKGYTIAVRATLNILFNRLWLFEGDTNWHTNQLMIVDSICLPDRERHFGNGSLQVTLTPETILWLSRQPENQHIESVVKLMKQANDYIWYQDKSSLFCFGALVRKPKWLNMSVPGDACGLDPDDYNNLDIDRGYKLVPHNVDSALQQFTFIAGLAKLHGLIRESHEPTL